VVAPVMPQRREFDMSSEHRIREARLRPEEAHRYPWIQPGEWQPAAILADRVLAGHLLRGRDDVIWGRVLIESHFEFRGGSARAGERATIRP
jgi:hypothetical protein